MTRTTRIVLAVGMGLISASMLGVTVFFLVMGPMAAAIPTVLLAAAFGYFLYHDVKNMPKSE